MGNDQGGSYLRVTAVHFGHAVLTWCAGVQRVTFSTQFHPELPSPLTVRHLDAGSVRFACG